MVLTNVSLTHPRPGAVFEGRIQAVSQRCISLGISFMAICHRFRALSIQFYFIRLPRLPTADYIWVLCRWKRRYFSENLPKVDSTNCICSFLNSRGFFFWNNCFCFLKDCFPGLLWVQFSQQVNLILLTAKSSSNIF